MASAEDIKHHPIHLHCVQKNGVFTFTVVMGMSCGPEISASNGTPASCKLPLTTEN
jgi:hypothetical protein